MNAAPQDRARAFSRVRDELAWELMRDEWDLLLAIGSGPTTIEAAAAAVGRATNVTATAVELLERHGLVRAIDGGFALVPAYYERREGMASYLRDIVLERLRADTSPPLAGAFLQGFLSVDEIESFIRRVEGELLPAVVDLASQPESEASERFSILFAAADEVPPGVTDAGLRTQLLEVLKSAAAFRNLDPERKSAFMWVAEMRTDPHVAADVGETMQTFFESTEAATRPPRPGGPAAVFAVLSGPARSRR
jgi:hypothetical protein